MCIEANEIVMCSFKIRARIREAKKLHHQMYTILNFDQFCIFIKKILMKKIKNEKKKNIVFNLFIT